MSIEKRFLFVILVVFLVGFGGDVFLSYRDAREQALNSLLSQADNTRAMMMATRRVYQKQFIESGIPLTEKTVGFLPAHSFSRISKDFSNWTKSGLTFNNVSDRPRNPDNMADPLELEIMGFFRDNPSEKVVFRPFEAENGDPYYIYARPIWIETFCLKCHGEREKAPPTIRNSYSTSFGYKLGDLRGLISIKLPAQKVMDDIMSGFTRWVGLSLFGFSATFLLIVFMVRRYVRTPLEHLAGGMDEIAAGKYDRRLEGFEGELAPIEKSFNTMAAEIPFYQDSLRKLSQAVEQSPVEVIIADALGIIEYVNPCFIRNSGLSFVEAIGQEVALLCPDKMEADEFRATWQGVSVNGRWRGEFRKTRLDESVHWESMSITPIRAESGELTHHLLIKQDITDHKMAEEDLRRLNRELENRVEARTRQLSEAKDVADQANAAKSEFLAKMSHELRTPLNSIIGLSEMLYEDASEANDEEYVEPLKRVTGASQHLMDLINDILDLSKIEAGKLELEWKEVQLSTLIDQIRSTIHPLSEAKNNKLTIGQYDEQLVIWTDMVRLRQVLLNLLSNANNHTENGEIFLTVSRLENGGDPLLTISVEDTGAGIPENQMQGLFDEFSQARLKDSASKGGTGLGLAISKRIVQIMGGKIGVESEEGVGSTFWFEIPIAEEKPTPIKGPETS